MFWRNLSKRCNISWNSNFESRYLKWLARNKTIWTLLNVEENIYFEAWAKNAIFNQILTLCLVISTNFFDLYLAFSNLLMVKFGLLIFFGPGNPEMQLQFWCNCFKFARVFIMQRVRFGFEFSVLGRAKYEGNGIIIAILSSQYHMK